LTGDRRAAAIYTIGHSTRTLDELVAMLRAFGVSFLADIRTIPRSRRNPQFNAERLRAVLRRAGIRYVAVPKLGGLRRARADSPNTGWRNASFRGYADYMSTEMFETGIAQLEELTRRGTVALMCAEAVPWRCHRSLVADALVARGVRVEHILTHTRANSHRMTPFAQVHGSRITYPGGAAAGTRLATASPFHLEATVRVLQRTPANRADSWEQRRYLRVLTHGGDLALIAVENHGTIDAPELRMTVREGDASKAARVAFARSLHKTLGLGLDPHGLDQLARVEPRAGAIAIALRGMRPPRHPDLFEAFASVVPFQQLSLDAGVAVLGRLVERFGRSLEHLDVRHYAFPTADAVAAARLDRLRACGLSARKADSLRALARLIARGELTESAIAALTTKRALERLSELPGIGPWSAGLVLLRGLGRLDVFPPGDVGAQRRLRALLQLGPRVSVDRIAARCGDLRGYLYFCALGSEQLAQGLVHAAPSLNL
jgi:3-methyladenine DNA glycosylase/8-oxoguanine DNA glycosylase